MAEMIVNNDQGHKIFVEQIKNLYQALLPILFVNVMISSALVYGLWEVAPQKTLLVWLGLQFFLFFVRISSYLIYKRNFTAEYAKRYALYFVVGAGLSGSLWGIGCAVFFPEQLEYQLFILFVLVGMGAGAVSSLTTYLPAFFAYLPVSLIPVGIQFTLAEGSIQLSLGAMLVVYIIALSYFSLNINRSLLQSLTLRFENIDLVEQLRQQKDEAEQANISKSKFLAAASHDLRQPLHALTLFTSVLDESIESPEVRKVVDQISASVHALKSLFNALLDISRLDAGVMQVEKADFNLQPMFEKLANDFDPQASEKGLSISWPTCLYAIHSDQNLCEQILRNYISNAIRYSNDGEVQIHCEAEAGLVCIQVIDTGVGIAEEDQQVIFEEFHQLNNPERDRSKGLGLGLAIVQRTANLLGHDVGLNSRAGKGSTFFIRIEQANLSKTPTMIKTDIDVLPTNKVLIVVVDDEHSVREGTQSLLQAWGCDVMTAADEQEVMSKLKQKNQAPDGIIADYRLRDNQTGIEVIHAIQKKYRRDIPILIVTGDTAVEHLREVNSSGFQVLHKPVAAVKLRTFLRNVQLKSG